MHLTPLQSMIIIFNSFLSRQFVLYCKGDDDVYENDEAIILSVGEQQHEVVILFC
jgi:hypothetical protein